MATPCRMPSSRGRAGLLLGLWLVLPGAAGWAGEPAREMPSEVIGDVSGEEALRRVNERRSGTQYRRARLSLFNDGELARRYVVETVRTSGPERAVTLFFLDRPETLRGTAFLLEESRPARVEGTRIWLHLPAGRPEPLEIEAERARQSLLGSDFTYQDWRVWLPVGDLRLERRPDGRSGGGRVLRISAEPSSAGAARSLGWGHALLRVDAATGVLVGAEYAPAPGEPPERIFEASALRRVDGEWIPGRMEMRDLRAGRSTVVELLDAWHHRPVPAGWFAPEGLTRLGERLEQLPGAGPSSAPAAP